MAADCWWPYNLPSLPLLPWQANFKTENIIKMAAVAVAQAPSQLENPRDKALQDYRKKILEHKEIEGRLKESKWEFILL